MKKFLKRRGLLLVVIVILLCAITIGSLYLSGNRSTFVMNTVNVVTAPIKGGIRAGVGALENLYGYLYEYDKLKEENERLHEENAQLQSKQEEAEQAIKENGEYEKMLNLDEEIRNMKKVGATVTEWTSSNWASSFTISKGSRNDIEVGDSVINSSGEVVGQVINVGTNWATVRTIVDTASSIGATVGDTSAIASGDFEFMQEGLLKLSNVPSTALLNPGDRVYTSGAGEVFPQGLVIGTIKSVETESSGLTQYAIIDPSADLGNLNMVFVIIEYEITG